MEHDDFRRIEPLVEINFTPEAPRKYNATNFANQLTKDAAAIKELSKPEKPPVEQFDPEPVIVERGEEGSEQPAKKIQVENLMSFDDEEPQSASKTEVQQFNFGHDSFKWVNPNEQARTFNEINPNVIPNNYNGPVDSKEGQKQARIQVIDDALGNYRIQPKISYNNPYSNNSGGFLANLPKENIVTFSNYGGLGQINGGYAPQNYPNNFYRNSGNANGFF